jgi:cardiolipin synthase
MVMLRSLVTFAMKQILEVIYLNVVLLVLYFFLVISAFLAVMLDNRQPIKTIAWILFLFLVPVVGLLFYYFFGQNIRRERRFNKKSFGELTHKPLVQFVRQSTIDYPEKYVSLIRFFKMNSIALPFSGNAADFYTEGRDFVDSLVKDISQARHHVHLEFYIIEDDGVGRRVAEALAEAVERGVQVRFLYDDVGCWTVKKRFFRHMENQGIRVAAFGQVHFRRLSHRVNYRNHRKLTVIDGCIGYIGGMNLADRYVYGEKGGNWRDLHMRITGAAVYGIQQLFIADWYHAAEEMISSAEFFPETIPMAQPGALVQIVSTAPFGKWPTIMMGFDRVIQNARKYIFIQTPYFMPTETVLESLQTAALSGVKVQIMVPLKPGGFWMTWANESYYGDVLKAGAEVFAYKPGMLHAKAMIVDDDFCSVGSANLDFRSLGQTFEDSAFIYDTEMTQRVKQLFIDARQDCMKIDLDMWNGRNLRRRILESFVRIFSPLF